MLRTIFMVIQGIALLIQLIAVIFFIVTKKSEFAIMCYSFCLINIGAMVVVLSC